MVEVVTFTSTLTNTREYRQTAVLGGDVVDQFNHVYGFTNTGTTEQTNFTTLGKRANQVDNLDAGFQQVGRRCKLFVLRCSAVNFHALFFTDGTTFVDGVTQYIHDTAQSFCAHGYFNFFVGVVDVQSAAQALRRTQRDRANHAITQLLLYFEGQTAVRNCQCVINLWHGIARKLHVDNGADNLYDTSATHVRFLLKTLKIQNPLHASFYYDTAAAPPTISDSSCVIAA